MPGLPVAVRASVPVRRRAPHPLARPGAQTAVFDDLQGKSPLHARELWPEHSSLKFTFAHNHEQSLQYFVTPDALRPEMPNWAAPRMPIAQSRSLNQPQEPHSLLTNGVRVAGVPQGQLKSFVAREWTCVCFLSALEASRRVAILTAIAYEPLAQRTRHGRLQGTFFAPMHLYTWEELERWEAASFIQAAEMARRSRLAFIQMLHVARANRAEEAARRASERDRHSLFNEAGELEISATVPPPALLPVQESPVSHLNLSREQLERMLDGQAQVLGVYGLPPVVSAQQEIGKVLQEQLTRDAQNMREASAMGKVLMRERRAAEVAAAREAMVAARGGYGADELSGAQQRDELVAMQQASEGLGGDAVRPRPPPEGGGGPAPPSARALMQMMQSVVAARQDSYDDVAAASARLAEQKRMMAASLRAELKQAHAELLADKELERQELLVQSRLERRQLQHALDERNRGYAAEIAAKHDARRATKDALSGRAASRAFTGSFVRQQNSMVRQLQLGDLRRKREEEVYRTAAYAADVRMENEAHRAKAASEAKRRADALRERSRQDSHDVTRRREHAEATHQRELDMVRLKQAQLRDIRTMLAQPVDVSGGLPAILGLGGGALEGDHGAPLSPTAT